MALVGESEFGGRDPSIDREDDRVDVSILLRIDDLEASDSIASSYWRVTSQRLGGY